MNTLLKALSGQALLWVSQMAYASAPLVSFTDTAENILVPLSLVSIAIHKINLIAGVAFIIAAFLKYRAYRTNSSQVPLSRPVLLLILGLVLLAIPFIANLSTSVVSLPHWQ